MTGLRAAAQHRANAVLRSIDSPALGSLAWQAAERRRVGEPLSLRYRHTVEALQPSDPLAASHTEAPPIDLVFVAHPRDADLLDVAIGCAVAASHNPISRTVIVVPDEFVESGSRRYPAASVIAESTVVAPAIAQQIHRQFGRTAGWVLQQALKFRAVLMSRSPACLIVDADTLLLRPRTWLTESGVQLLAPSLEYWEPYAEHVARMWPDFENRTALSWVTHHQLMQKDIVSEMFGTDGERLEEWIARSEAQQQSPLSEYHSYGTFLFTRHRERLRLAQWNNVARPRAAFPTARRHDGGLPRISHPGGRRPHSASFHHYL